jgi:hypothetical protein
MCYNPTVATCVRAGKRLKPSSKPATPEGKQIKTETLVQDDKDPSKCKWVVTYEDTPVVIAPVIIPEVTTNIVIGRLSFAFTTNGWPRGVMWLDAPKTNKVAQ